MIFKKLTIVVFVLSFNVVFSQQIEKVKNKDILITYVQKRKMSKESLDRLESLPELFKERLYFEHKFGYLKELLIADDGSSYKSKVKIEDKFEVVDDTDVAGYNKIEKTTKHVQSTFYKRNEDNLLLLEKGTSDNVNVIKEKLHTFNWTLTKEKKEINGNVCYKAYTKDFKGRKVSAWYNPEIKIKNGPLEYGGLPGLIVELSTKSFNIKLKNLKILEENTSIIEFPSTLNAITFIAYDKKYNRKKGGLGMYKRKTTTTERSGY